MPPRTVLIVDADTAQRRLMVGWLREAGYTVAEAATGAQAFDRLATRGIDLVILSAQLPDTSGVEAAREIKTDPQTAKVPVIHLATAANDRAREAPGGADGWVAVPLDPGELVAAARGAREIFDRPVWVLILAPDGRTRYAVCRDGRTERLKAPPGALDRLSELMGLGEDADTQVARMSAQQWRRLLPEAAPRGDVMVVMVRSRQGTPPICSAIEIGEQIPDAGQRVFRQLGQAQAIVVDALRSYAEERFISRTLQHSLLPTERPSVPGWTFAVRYVPTAQQTEVGGDFYEMVDCGDQVLVAVGDVQGHSLRAVTVMAEIRYSLRAYAREGHDAVTILHLLNAIVQRYHDDQTVTLCLVTLEPGTGRLQVASAGHPPPLYITPDNSWYGSGGGVLLGLPVDDVATEQTLLPPGGTLVLFTDGLVEDRGVDLADGLDRLRTVAANVDADLERFSDRVIATFGRREDDVAFIAMRRDT